MFRSRPQIEVQKSTARRDPADGSIYYGGGIVSDQGPAPIDHVGLIRSPVIAFFGAQDQHIPRDHVARLEQAHTAAGVPNEVYYYPQAGHGFFCDARQGFSPPAATDAWHRTLLFFETRLGPVPNIAWD